MGSKRISNYTSKPSSCLIYVCCHGGLLIALNLASNFGRTIFGWVGPVLASKTSPARPNYVDQTWSGRTDFFPGPIFSLQARPLFFLQGVYCLQYKRLLLGRGVSRIFIVGFSSARNYHAGVRSTISACKFYGGLGACPQESFEN